jgi:hypothetical protein
VIADKRLLDADGHEISFEHPDDFAIPHVYTFGSMMTGGWLSYFHEHHDEAMKHRRENGLAMYRDAYLQALLRERANGTMRLQWHLESDNPKDPTEKATTDALTKVIRSIRWLRRIRRWSLRGALWYGRYGVQVKWGWETQNIPTPEYSGPAEAGMAPTVNLRPQRVMTIVGRRPVNGDKIGFRWDGTPYILASTAQAFGSRYNFETIMTTSGYGILLRDPRLRRQILVHSYDPEDADYFESEMAGGIYGIGIRSRIYWLDWMRREYLSWITDTFERIGLGLVVIYYADGDAAAKEQAKTIAKTYSRRSAIIMPRSPDRTWQHGSVEVVEAPISGAQIVLELAKDIEGKIERLIVGQSMSSGADASTGLGGTGRAMLAGDTKGDIIADDAEDHAEFLTGGEIDTEPGLVNMIFRWSFPELWGKFPVSWRYNIDDGMQSMMKLQGIAAAAGMGVTFPMKEIRNLTGVREPEEGEEIVGGAPQLGMPGAGGAGAPGQPGAPGAGEPDLNALLHGMAGGSPEGNGNGMKLPGMNGRR